MSFLKVHLKQHTPIIHFQHKQDGHTLRATELKPKLDKYIEKLHDFYDETQIPIGLKTCLESKFQNKGRYKVTISNEKCLRKIVPKRLYGDDRENGEYDDYEQCLRRSLYFGKIKAMSVYANDIKITFRTFEKNVLSLIYLALPVMLCMENFGSRSNKGFGSFYLSDIDGTPDIFLNSPLNQKYMCNPEKIYKEHLKDYNIYYFDLNSSSFVNIFEMIYYFYNALKSGINEPAWDNRPEKYYKSLLWKYFYKHKGMKLIWEKRAIKSAYIKDKIPNENTPQFKNNYKYIRTLLGFTPIFEFKSTSRGRPARMDGNYEVGKPRPLKIFEGYRNGKPIGFAQHVEIIGDKLTRIESPITFKPICNGKGLRIYIILRPEKYIDNKNIDIRKLQYKFVNLGNKAGDRNFKTIDTFDLNEFFRYAAGELNDLNGSADKMIPSPLKSFRIKGIDDNLIEKT